MGNSFNKLLTRQIKRHFGSTDALPEELKSIIGDINNTYENFENDTIYASVFSQPTILGMTEEWNFFDLRKEENFTEIFHDFINRIQ